MDCGTTGMMTDFLSEIMEGEDNGTTPIKY